jgi:hypothetical protein
MKSIILACVILLLLACGYAQADNRIMIMVDTIRSSTYDIPVGFENDSALQGISNGYRLSTTGDVTAAFLDGAGYLDTLSRGGVIPQVIGWIFRYAGPDFDTVLVGGGYL